MTQSRESSGLGFKDCLAHSKALLSKWITKPIDDPTSEWASLFFELLGKFSWDQRRTMNCACYTSSERLLFGSIKSFGALKYTTRLWKSWITLRRHLSISLTCNLIPAHWRTSNITNSLLHFANMEVGNIRLLNITLGKLGITITAHLWDESTATWNFFWHQNGTLARHLKGSRRASITISQSNAQSGRDNYRSN